MFIFSRLFLIFTFIFALSTITFADPVQITSGVANFSIGSNFNLTASDSSRFIGSSVGGNTFPSAGVYKIKTPITLITELFASTGSINSGNNDFRGIYTNANAMTTTSVYVGSNSFTNFSSLVFTSQSFEIPMSATSVFTVQVPFTMQGILRPIGDCTVSPNICNQLINSQNVAGNGISTYTFEQNASGDYKLYSQSFNFQTPEPTPEPATLILMGTGLAGIFGYAKRRKMKKQSA